MGWRMELERLVRHKASDAGLPYYIVFVHPPHYYRYGEGLHKSEREAMQWDLAQVRDSDIVVADMSSIADSVGTHMELGYAEAINQIGSKHIHIIGVGVPIHDHPWLREVLLRQENTLEEAADYIVNYLLI